jgi:hypothetical protein
MAPRNQTNQEGDDDELLLAAGLDPRMWGAQMRSNVASELRNLLPPLSVTLARWLGWGAVFGFTDVRAFQTGRGQPHQCVTVTKGDYRSTHDGLVSN